MPPMLPILPMLPLPFRQPTVLSLRRLHEGGESDADLALRSEKLQYIPIGSEYSETSKRYSH